MRLRRAARLGGIIAAVLGIAATFMPAASAIEEKTVTFAGTATLGAGLDAPCAETVQTLTTGGVPPVGDPTPGTTKGDKDCPPVPVACPNGPTNCVNKKGKPVDTGGNTRAGAFTADTCVYTGVAVGKTPDKSDGPHAGLCTIRANFVVTGYCGLSQGAGQGTITFTEVVGVQRDAHFKFTWVDPGGGNLAILGNYWYGTATPPPTGQYEGDILAFVKATPLPTVPPGGNSCLNKTARTFEIAGGAALTHPKCLPGHNEPLPGCAT